MKTLLCCSLLALGFTHAAPTDEPLLKMVKERSKLERLTPEPKKVNSRFALQCAPLTKEQAAEQAKLRLVPGHEASSVHVYASAAAAQSYFDPWGKFSEGSLLLKEKLATKEDKSQGFTGMLKREAGYFPEGGDWEYFTVDGSAAKIIERGKMASCAECHGSYASGDFITKLSASAAQLSGGRIMLHSSKASPHGEKLQYEPIEKKNTLGFWVNAADWADWKFNVQQPGTYVIHIWQGCGTGSGGAEVEVSCAGQSSKFTVKDTGHFQNFEEREIGEVTFKEAGEQTLELRAKSKPGGAVMDCRQIILVPKVAK